MENNIATKEIEIMFLNCLKIKFYSLGNHKINWSQTPVSTTQPNPQKFAWLETHWHWKCDILALSCVVKSQRDYLGEWISCRSDCAERQLPLGARRTEQRKWECPDLQALTHSLDYYTLELTPFVCKDPHTNTHVFITTTSRLFNLDSPLIRT